MGIIDWFSRRNKTKDETRSTLRRPSNWLSTALGGDVTSSGENVTTDSALKQPAVWACVRLIAEDVASLPAKLYESGDDGVRNEVRSHPVARLLRDQPNAEMSPFTMIETITAHVLLYGNGYIEIERNGAGTPVALWPLMPDRVRIRIVDGQVAYEYQSGDTTTLLPSDKVIHIKGLGSDGVVGYSPVKYARETVGMSRALEKSGGAFFANSSRPSGILSHPGKLSEDAMRRLRESWQSLHSGASNTGRAAILEEGMSWTATSVPHDDAQWLEARQYALQDIARIYRVPPHMIGDLSRAHFNNIESQQIGYLQHTLMPWVRRWEQELNRKLLTATSDSGIFVEFLADGVLRGNTSDRFDAYKVARETGWLSVNEIRRRENLNPIDGGDSYIQPLNFMQLGESNDPAPSDDTTRSWMRDSVSRAAGLLTNAARRRMDSSTDSELSTWIQSQNGRLTSKVTEILEPACRCLGNSPEQVAESLVNGWQLAMVEARTKQQIEDAGRRWAEGVVTSSERMIEDAH